MSKEQKLDPRTMKTIESELRERASRPLPSLKVGEASYEGFQLLYRLFPDLPEPTRNDIERDIRLIWAARMDLIPILVDGEEQLRHKDLLTADDLPYVFAWREAEHRAAAESSGRSWFALDALKDIDVL